MLRLPLLLACLVFSHFTQASLGYFRDPAIHDNTVVFTAEGDLWIYQIGETSARRLTSNTALERQGAISQDGQSVAFTANYAGATEVYVLPTTGGLAKRMTFENSYVYLQGWTDDNQLLYSTNSRVGPANNWTLKVVDPLTLETRTLPLADAIEGVIDNQSKSLFFTQFGLQVSRDNARYYRGGAQGELWRYALGSDQEATLLTRRHDASAREPMVYDDKLYFISNKNGNDNLWVMSTSGKKANALTHYNDFPIRSAKLHNGRIIFQHGADLKLYDIASQATETLNISLTSDYPMLRDNWVNTPLKHLTSIGFSGKKKQVVLTARGQVAIANTHGRRLVEVSTPEASRTRKAVLSEDGKWVYAINDASGEMEIWRFAADGSSDHKQLTHDAKISRWQLVLSPDSKQIAYDDFNGDLFMLDIATETSQKVYSGQSEMSPYSDIVWSGDSQLLAITTNKYGDERSRIYLYNLKTQQGEVLTSDKYHSRSPAFSLDQQWLYFLSDREFTPVTSSPWGDRNMGTTFDRRTQIYAYALNAEAKFPFQKPNELADLETHSQEDSEEPNGEAADKAENADAKDTDEEAQLVDWQGLQDRLWQVPVASGNYSNLAIAKRHLYVVDRVTEPGSKPVLKAIAQKPKAKTSTFVSGISSYALSPDGKQLLIAKQSSKKDQIYVVPAGSSFPASSTEHKVNASSWKLRITPQQEWLQIFHDAWVMHRDFFFDKSMRGLDWPAVKQKYLPLLERITDRSELNDVLAQMIGELNVLHSQVYGGDFPIDTSRPTAASLGANLIQDAKGVVIENIYDYDLELPANASPLRKPGTDALPGDRIKAVNGKTINTLEDLHNALLNQANRQVILTLEREDITHKTVVYPVTGRQDAKLRYRDWVANNQRNVAQASEDIGYFHLYAMGKNDVADFAREFYAAYNKDGLIIDVRRNRGGNIDSWLLEKLLRKVWMFWTSGNAEPFTNMQQTFNGHLVILADQYTYSDGETFTAGVKAMELGTVIGKQTAGAGIWLRGLNRLSDGGMARVAELPVFATDGRWITEGHGIEPDIEVDNLPHATFNGNDAQLKAAIDYLKKRIKKKPIKPLKAKPYPAVTEPAQDVLD